MREIDAVSGLFTAIQQGDRRPIDPDGPLIAEVILGMWLWASQHGPLAVEALMVADWQPSEAAQALDSRLIAQRIFAYHGWPWPPAEDEEDED
ncbi:hypothetical protein [Sulfobacillus harzensis]|uniref:Uncharacterized protein n=1 Tax=Sulfobacillus harzensis TaxID=2729629 RepID=A0A7Y0L6U5_9FIRM|nr:hypothetical protein [Sulfobacillus harzensis]NMP23816.1 hypothetical protein [Sulfobacillus harzensis]